MVERAGLAGVRKSLPALRLAGFVRRAGVDAPMARKAAGPKVSKGPKSPAAG